MGCAASSPAKQQAMTPPASPRQPACEGTEGLTRAQSTREDGNFPRMPSTAAAKGVPGTAAATGDDL
eukprot:scaffold262925_cov16-Tisochrysis_lutea.AAC.2